MLATDMLVLDHPTRCSAPAEKPFAVSFCFPRQLIETHTGVNFRSVISHQSFTDGGTGGSKKDDRLESVLLKQRQCKTFSTAAWPRLTAAAHVAGTAPDDADAVFGEREGRAWENSSLYLCS